MNLQPTSTVPCSSLSHSGYSKTLPLPSGERDGVETWKEHHISQQVCRAESEKALQKPAHSDLSNWCLSQRGAKPPGNSLDQAPRTRRTGQAFPQQAPAGLWMWEGKWSEQKNTQWQLLVCMSGHGALGIASLYTISEPRQASKLKWTGQSIQKSLEQNKKLINSFLL